MTLTEWLVQPAGRLVTLALLHFVWQGFAAALFLATFVELASIRTTHARYVCSLVALVVMMLCPLGTLAWLVRSGEGAQSDALSAAEYIIPPPLGAELLNPDRWLPGVQPYLLAVWLCGVLALGSRLTLGAAGLLKLRRGRLPLPTKLAPIVKRLGKQMHIDALPLVYLSRQITEAMAVGLVRPLVLIPASWATEVPVEMLEAVIAHELAHLRRRDLWINLLQRLVETLLFYHPAVWWLSRRLRIERELCADELAVAATGKRLEYAQALEQIAHQRQADIRPALAAFLRGETNMRLLERVRNVLRDSVLEGPANDRPRLWPAGVVALALPLGLWLAAAINGSAIADDERAESRQVKIKRARDDGDDEKEKREIVIVRKRGEEKEERKEPKKGATVEERLERKIITADGKPQIELRLTRDELRDDRGDRRIDELTALVKRLASQVDRLQDDVAQLRGQKISGKQNLERDEQPTRNKQPARNELEAGKREIQEAARQLERAGRFLWEKESAEAREQTLKERAIKEQGERTIVEKKRAGEGAGEGRERELKEKLLKEKLLKEKPLREQAEIEQAIAEKKRAVEEKARAAARSASDKAASEVEKKMERAREELERAVREKGEAERGAIERKLRELKERNRDIDADEAKEVLLRKLREKQTLIDELGKPDLKKSELKKPTVKELIDREDE